MTHPSGPPSPRETLFQNPSLGVHGITDLKEQPAPLPPEGAGGFLLGSQLGMVWVQALIQASFVPQMGGTAL